MFTLTPDMKAAILAILGLALAGAFGSVLEAIGNAKKWPWLVALGKKLEAGPNDLPKLLGYQAPDPALLKSGDKMAWGYGINVASALGLPDDATVEEVISAIRALAAKSKDNPPSGSGT